MIPLPSNIRRMSATLIQSSRPRRFLTGFALLLALAVLTPPRFAAGEGQARAVRISPAPAPAGAFGALHLGAIGGTVFVDADQDGEQSLVEPGLANAELRLYGDGDANGQIDTGDVYLAQTFSLADGGYIFRDLQPGDYVLLITTPSGARPTTPVVRAVHLVTGEVSGAAYDFGAFHAGGLRLYFPSIR